ncbi:MAG: hypothetical protein JWM05_2364 [Acidimicrobiales bacterium]|nr:hypothetical protein [Acidimicrobiales bacterium]
MLGRKNFTREEIDHAKAAVDAQLVAYKALVKAAGKGAAPAIAAFEPLFFNNLILALDRPFVHRVRLVTGKDGNALNEVEVVVDSLMNNDGLLDVGTVIKLVPDESVLKLEVGDRIQVTEEQFERLAAAFFAELESKFL